MYPALQKHTLLCSLFFCAFPLALPAQQQALENTIDDWMRAGKEAQIDDIMVIGIQLKLLQPPV